MNFEQQLAAAMTIAAMRSVEDTKGVLAELESFPPNSNPYHHDLYHCGEDFGKNYHLMYGSSRDYLIVIETKTGRRFKLNLIDLFNS